MEKEIRKRDTVFDIMKGLSIFLVVFGHTYNSLTHNFIYLFHVSIFFIISGYFFNLFYLDSKESFFVLIRKRISSLWIPYVCYNFIALLLQNVFLKIGILTADKEAYQALGCFLPDGCNSFITIKSAAVCIVKSFFFMNSRPFAGGLWFLGGLFFVTFFYSIVQILLKKIKCEKFHILFSILFLICGFLFEYYKMPAKIPLFKQIDIILISEFMFAAGIMLKQIHVIDFLRKIKLYLKIIIVSTCVLVLILCSKVGTISIAGRNIIDPLFYIFVSILGFVLIYYLSLALSQLHFIDKVFIYLGEHTIPVLALHTLSFKLVTLLQYIVYDSEKIILTAYPVWKNSLLWSLTYVVIGIAVPLLITYPLSKIKIIKRLFLL